MMIGGDGKVEVLMMLTVGDDDGKVVVLLLMIGGGGGKVVLLLDVMFGMGRFTSSARISSANLLSSSLSIFFHDSTIETVLLRGAADGEVGTGGFFMTVSLWCQANMEAR